MKKIISFSIYGVFLLFFMVNSVEAKCYENVCGEETLYSPNNINNDICQSTEVDEEKCDYPFESESQENTVDIWISEIYDAKQMYLDLIGEEDPTITMTEACYGSGYWWPIGSSETEERNGKLFAIGDPSSLKINSKFNNAESFRTSTHKGLDIGSSGGENSDYIIAAQSGTVIYPLDTSNTSYGTGYYGSKDGGGFGNYVAVQHSDGTVAYYGHMYKDTITVVAGETVEQGQVLGKMGSSGSSTGPHLHFEMRLNGVAVNPLDYVSKDDPRPGVSNCSGSFSLSTTTLTREEFVHKMQDYCDRKKYNGFCNNFASIAGEIYDTSLEAGVNPELVVVTAGTEQFWNNCGTSNNYWGIGIYNGQGCASGAQYASLLDGIKGYAGVLEAYQPGGSYADTITDEYYKRLEAGADPAGIGLPGTFAGMQMVYAYLGKHEYGSSGAGGYYFMDPARAGVTAIYSTHEEFVNKCLNVDGEHAEGAPVTAWEQSRYVIWIMQQKNKFRYDIFGL